MRRSMFLVALLAVSVMTVLPAATLVVGQCSAFDCGSNGGAGSQLCQLAGQPANCLSGGSGSGSGSYGDPLAPAGEAAGGIGLVAGIGSLALATMGDSGIQFFKPGEGETVDLSGIDLNKPVPLLRTPTRAVRANPFRPVPPPPPPAWQPTALPGTGDGYAQELLGALEREGIKIDAELGLEALGGAFMEGAEAEEWGQALRTLSLLTTMDDAILGGIVTGITDGVVSGVAAAGTDAATGYLGYLLVGVLVA